MEFHFYDFGRSPELLLQLKKFVNGVKSKKLQKWVSSIHRSLQKVCFILFLLIPVCILDGLFVGLFYLKCVWVIAKATSFMKVLHRLY